MSDWIEVDGKKYFEESYLQLANANAKRAQEALVALRAQEPSREEIARVLEAVKNVHGGDGCACISDLPGDNYTCTSHETLWKFAHTAPPAPQAEPLQRDESTPEARAIWADVEKAASRAEPQPTKECGCREALKALAEAVAHDAESCAGTDCTCAVAQAFDAACSALERCKGGE